MRLVQDRQARAALEAAAAGWAAKGHRVINPAEHAVQLPASAACVRELADPDGGALGQAGYCGTGGAHAGRPDLAVVIGTYSGPGLVQEVCLNPARNGPAVNRPRPDTRRRDIRSSCPAARSKENP